MLSRSVRLRLKLLLASALLVVATQRGAVADTAALMLQDDFEAGRFAGDGGLFYKDNDEQRAGRVAFDEAGAFRGQRALKLSLLPSCKPGAAGCSERAEVWETPKVLAPYDRTVWYGFAMRMDDPVPQDDKRYVMAQWKREIIPGAAGDYSPFLALRLFRGKLGVTVETDRVPSFRIGSKERPKGCLPGEARVLDRPKAQQTRALVATEAGSSDADYPDYFNACAPMIQVTTHAGLPKAQAGWIDLVFRSSPGPRGGGRIEILAGGVHVATVTGHIGHEGPGLDRNQYFKFGPYRAPAKGRWSVSYDDFRRGPRCADVIRAGQCPQE